MANPSQKKLLVVLGTRPEAIKLAPLILALRKVQSFSTTICATGQHREMLETALRPFDLVPEINLRIMSENQSLNSLSCRAIEGIDGLLQKRNFDAVVVQGDTTTCATAAMAAFNRQVPVFHVEAGLRTANLQSPFPEEFNRRLVAIAAQAHFCPTPQARDNLIKEGVSEKDILVTGNTGIDSLYMQLEKDRNTFLDQRLEQLKDRSYILATLHRRESFGSTLRDLFGDLKQIAAEQSLSVILPLHLNPRVRVEAELVFGQISGWAGNVLLCEPVQYPDFVRLLFGAALVITDSGGIQEEGAALGKPMLICRDHTERPEALMQSNIMLIQPGEARLLNATRKMLASANAAKPSDVFGSGNASEQIVEGIKNFFERGAINPKVKSSVAESFLEADGL